MKVIKSNGSIEEFEPQKLINSLVRVGADVDEAIEIADIIQTRLKDPTPTRFIYKYAKQLLKQLNHKYMLKYSLKKAMMRIGPSGYPFERFFAELLKKYGYQTKIDIVEKGRCIEHEIDVLALKGEMLVSVECKYHSSQTRASDAKVAMYINSRFIDLKESLLKKYRKQKFEGWLVTNTRLTTDAVKFARCYGFKAIGWRYPEDGGLEKLIENKHFYPVTVLTGIKLELLKRLINHEIVTVSDFYNTPDSELEKLGFSLKKIRQLKKQAYVLQPT